jgi:hypothetical protein
MANSIERASDLLITTEKTLRDLVSDSAMSGDYASVVRIAEWAQSIREMLGGKLSKPTAERPPTPAKAKLKASGTRKPPMVRKQSDYPRFLQNGHELIRLAWSKREKREYRHKAPYSVVQAVARVMQEKGVEGRVFSTDDLLPLRDGDAADIPNYQAYVAIALFKHAGLIDQHGREGYSIRQPRDFANAVEAVWKNLPKQ